MFFYFTLLIKKLHIHTLFPSSFLFTTILLGVRRVCIAAANCNCSFVLEMCSHTYDTVDIHHKNKLIKLPYHVTLPVTS